jgi:ribosomal protein S18 acetylase RimI-like enzyme
MTISIRLYRPEDLGALKRLTVSSFGPVCIDKNIEATFGLINGHDWAWRKARHIDVDVAREPEGIFVAESADAVVGYITTWSDSEASVGNIPNLAVDANFRGQGIGRQLIDRALQHFRSLGLTHARIETLAQNEVGQNLYPSMGFKEVARQVHYCADLSENES